MSVHHGYDLMRDVEWIAMATDVADVADILLRLWK
jgi:hypothetical protein